jgi:DNA recombination protein RmuC
VVPTGSAGDGVAALSRSSVVPDFAMRHVVEDCTVGAACDPAHMESFVVAVPLVVVLALVAGFSLGLVYASRRTRDDHRALSQQLRALTAEAVAESRSQTAELADARLRATEHVVAPVKDSLDRFAERIRDLEVGRITSQATMREQLEQLRVSGESLRRETAALSTALRRPQVRGRWGELHLQRAVELAGMVDRCDFAQQVHTTGDTGVLRPDLVVNLAGGKHVAVDAKVPLDAFLDATSCDDPDERDAHLSRHARQLRHHVDSLASKAYWTRLSNSPEFVVLFVPGDAFLSHALESDPGLLEHAALKQVILATPSTLIALLRTVSYAWTQEALADNAAEIHALGRELYDRLGTLGQHLDHLGRSLNGAVGSYNKAIGSLETRVLVSARRLRDLEVSDGELAAPRPIEDAARPLGAPELLEREPAAEVVRGPPGRETWAPRASGE